MKKKIIVAILLCLISLPIFSQYNIIAESKSIYNNSNYTYSDIVKYFLLETIKIDYQKYPYIVYSYIIYPDKESQDYNWGVGKSEKKSYYDYEFGEWVYCISVALFMRNGYFVETHYTRPSWDTNYIHGITSQRKHTNDTRTYSGFAAAVDDRRSTILQFSQESKLTLKRYGLSMDREEKQTFDNWVASLLME